jgi:hypothetical protein
MREMVNRLLANAFGVESVKRESVQRRNRSDIIPDGRDTFFNELLLFLWSDEFLEAGIITKRIEHWIEPEKCWSERHALNHRASVRHRE